MTDKATVSSEYWWRVVLFAVVFLVIGFWSLYDGFIGYPQKQHIAQEFLRFKDEGRREEWPDHAKSQGWPIEDPGKPKGDNEIYLQFVMAGLTLPVGLVFASGLIRSRSKWIGIEDGALVTSWGERVSVDTVTKLDKRRWKSKGIAVVHYQDSGKTRRLVLDDWKYTRQPITNMVEMVQDKISPDKIVEPAASSTDAKPETSSKDDSSNSA